MSIHRQYPGSSTKAFGEEVNEMEDFALNFEQEMIEKILPDREDFFYRLNSFGSRYFVVLVA